MKLKITLGFLVLFVFAEASFSQTEVTIRKKTSMKIPGMPEMSSMPNGMANPMKDRSSVVYIKGSRMRTDMKYQQPKMSIGGGTETVTQTTIVQCDRKQSVTYNSKKKKYYVDPLAGQTAAATKNSKKGGYITITGGVTDTGERAKLFGYEARHLKETYTMTPSKNACQKQTMTIEIEGWYADVPEFSCPAQRKPREFQMEQNCFDDVDFQVKGLGITGFALKEIKKMTVEGMTIIIEEEATSVTKTPIADSMFEPPTGYQAANTLKEVEDDSPDNSTGANTTTTTVEPPVVPPTSTFTPPKAGLEKAVGGPKQSGMLRIGVAKPKVTTPETKNDPDAGTDIANAARDSLVESLKADGIEAIPLETDFPDNECSEKQCDYVFHSTVTQKRGGGGMFGKMVAMTAVSVAGAFIPGIGGMVASTVASQIMGQAMMKNAKAKDEFALEYKLTSMDKSVVAQATTKKKAEKDGDDVLTPMIVDASKAVLPKVKK